MMTRNLYTSVFICFLLLRAAVASEENHFPRIFVTPRPPTNPLHQLGPKTKRLLFPILKEAHNNVLDTLHSLNLLPRGTYKGGTSPRIDVEVRATTSTEPGLADALRDSTIHPIGELGYYTLLAAPEEGYYRLALYFFADTLLDKYGHNRQITYALAVEAWALAYGSPILELVYAIKNNQLGWKPGDSQKREATANALAIEVLTHLSHQRPTEPQSLALMLLLKHRTATRGTKHCTKHLIIHLTGDSTL